MTSKPQNSRVNSTALYILYLYLHCFSFTAVISVCSIKMATQSLMYKKGNEKRKLKEIKEAFDAADKDGDGKLSPEEWHKLLKNTGFEAKL